MSTLPISADAPVSEEVKGFHKDFDVTWTDLLKEPDASQHFKDKAKRYFKIRAELQAAGDMFTDGVPFLTRFHQSDEATKSFFEAKAAGNEVAADFHAETVFLHAAFAAVMKPRVLKLRQLKEELDVEAETGEVISEEEEQFDSSDDEEEGEEDGGEDGGDDDNDEDYNDDSAKDGKLKGFVVVDENEDDEKEDM